MPPRFVFSGRLGTGLCLVSAFLLASGAVQAADGHRVSESLFLMQVLALLVCGRLAGELMHRIGQPAVMGQLLAGIALGPSVLGALFPDLQHALFAALPEQKAMI